MDNSTIQDKQLTTALCQFIFPFSINSGGEPMLIKQLIKDGYLAFHLDCLEDESAFYGEGYRVSHPRMERYYLPFTANVLFPRDEGDPEAFLRYSRACELSCLLRTRYNDIPFVIHSVDVVICPFNLGFITIRTELKDEAIPYTTALEFVSRFRVLQDVSPADDFTYICLGEKQYGEVEKFIFEQLASSILPFLDKSGMEGAYFETLPFFVDERMYVMALYSFIDGTEITSEDQFRAAQLDGMDIAGRPYISSTNPEFIESYCRKHGYFRWSPNLFYLTNEQAFCCLTNLSSIETRNLANEMYGEYYYGLLLNLFHKIVLLKLANQYSQVQLEQDNEKIEQLIRNITKFSAKYFFIELISQSQGREIFMQLRKIFGNDELFQDVKQTLADLFKYQDSFSSKRQGFLLMILTLYTVVTGIYGMNQVIDDLKGSLHWRVILHYSVFEYIALFVTLSGLLIGFILTINVSIQWVKELRHKKD